MKSANLISIVFGCVFLLFGVRFCIACNIIGVYWYLGAIYSFLGVKVTQDHACQWPILWLISAVTIQTVIAILSFGTFFLEQNECQIWNQCLLPMNTYTIYDPPCVTVTQGQPRSYEVTDLRKTSNGRFFWGKLRGTLECLYLFWLQCTLIVDFLASRR